MDDVIFVLDIGGLLLAAVAVIVGLVWASRRGMDSFAVAVGLGVLGVAVAEWSGHLVRDQWTTARFSLGLAFVVLGMASRWDPARETAQTLLKFLAAAGVAASCLALYGPHPARAMAVGLGLLCYMVGQGDVALAAALTGALYLSVGLAKSLRILPPHELGSDLFGASALIAMAVCAWRDASGILLRRLAWLVVAVVLVSAFWRGGFAGQVPKAENSATTFAILFATGFQREREDMKNMKT